MFVFTEFFLASVVTFSAFSVLGLTGFGSGLVMVPVLLLFLNIKLVVPSVLVLHGMILLFFTFTLRKLVEKRLLPLVLSGGFIGVFLGTYVLATYESLLLKKIFGIVVMLFALNMFFGGEKKRVLKLGNLVGFFAGLVSGAISALFGMGGPPVGHLF